MSLTDYLLNGGLIALVLLQVRGRRLTARLFFLPLVVVVAVAADYLHGVPTAGNNLVLVVAGAVTGLALGTGCGLATAIYRGDDGQVRGKAGALAAALWILGVGSRLAFALYAGHGGAGAIGRFSAAHGITSASAWVDCLVLMALAEVVSRSAVMGLRYLRLVPSSARLGPAPGAIMDVHGRPS